MAKRLLGNSGLSIEPLVLGTNVFGWTIDEKTSFQILDAFVDSGFSAIDTADVYSAWAPGNTGGESEIIIGNWLKANPSKRDNVLIFTKVGFDVGLPEKGLSRQWIMKAVDNSLKRLQIETIDLYQSHAYDADTPHEETLSAYAELIQAGKIRKIGCSNFTADQLSEALRISSEQSLPRYESVQPEYNLHNRKIFEGALQERVVEENIGVISYYGLAAGFLTGKYRSKVDLGKSKRGSSVERYLDERGLRILDALDAVSNELGVKPAEAAIAWIIAQKGITAPISSATSLSQLESLVRAARLTLPSEALHRLNDASAY
ncbi:aldo/keto reductase [Limoniibacter endophyticus]|uniref:NADP-dependent aryl-alcohol dehydrogenase n=1 Tax=Limoniibacter endophyticus TaxID=1565040 RepID=A0A8J3DGW4_9HYPH|nr:aldo/keto reductase [Limoniibacter endophyticus]GHC70436.1 NADP-dependent aryl-alcohol dehydrogenase [Limoniibacter endophyticus]